jgi:hypothetical protein
VKWYRKAAEQGDVEAQKAIAICYLEEKGVPQNMNEEQIIDEAMKWLQKAVLQGDAEAIYMYGTCFELGLRGYPVDYAIVAAAYARAAKLGFAPAQYSLGRLYLEGPGIGVKRNATKAVEWFLKAAEQGLSEAQERLAKCYEQGIGVNKDMKEAEKWARRALESYRNEE